MQAYQVEKCVRIQKYNFKNETIKIEFKVCNDIFWIFDGDPSTLKSVEKWRTERERERVEHLETFRKLAWGPHFLFIEEEWESCTSERLATLGYCAWIVLAVVAPAFMMWSQLLISFDAEYNLNSFLPYLAFSKLLG